jgi:hypothetical protein
MDRPSLLRHWLTASANSHSRRIASAKFVRANHAICTHVWAVNKIRICAHDFSAQRCAKRARHAHAMHGNEQMRRRRGDSAARAGGALFCARRHRDTCDADAMRGASWRDGLHGGFSRGACAMRPTAALVRRHSCGQPCARGVNAGCGAAPRPAQTASVNGAQPANANGRRGEPAAVQRCDAERENLTLRHLHQRCHPLQRAAIGGIGSFSAPPSAALASSARRHRRHWLLQRAAIGGTTRCSSPV